MRETEKTNDTILSELSDQNYQTQIANILCCLNKRTISMHNENRKKQNHIYIMAQADQERKENNIETFTMIKKKKKSKALV